ncbi:MAG: hypothetical protein ACRELA_02390 [Candidatus Rokuibacteriota bacterium]
MTADPVTAAGRATAAGRPHRSTAKAAVLRAPRTLEVREFPLPAIGPDEALLRLEACGICGTDYEQYEGDVPAHEYYTRAPVVGRLAEPTELSVSRA